MRKTMSCLIVLLATFSSQLVLAETQGVGERLESITYTYQEPEKVVLRVKNINHSQNFIFCVGGVVSIWDKVYCSSVSPAGESDIIMDAERRGAQIFILVPADLHIKKDPITSPAYPENTRLATDCRGNEYPGVVAIFIVRPDQGNAVTPASYLEVQAYKAARQRQLCRQKQPQ